MTSDERQEHSERAKYETTASSLVLAHYQEIGIVQGWTVKQVQRLCNELGITIFELGRLCAVFNTPYIPGNLPSHRALMSMISNNRFSPTASLHFAMIKDFLDSRKAERASTQAPDTVMPIHLIVK